MTVAVSESSFHSVLANEIHSGETLNNSDSSAFVVLAGIERNRKGNVAILRFTRYRGSTAVVAGSDCNNDLLLLRYHRDNPFEAG